MASYGVRSILQKDLNAVMGVVMISGVFFVVANLAIDVLVGFVDPRVRIRGAAHERSAAAPAPVAVSIAYQNWHRFSRNPTAVIGAVIVTVVVLAALLAPWIAPHPDHVGAIVNFRARHLPPSAQYWFGTDNVGRDIFTRVLFGYRISLLLAAVVLAFAVPLGATLGLIAGYFGGWAEIVIMRLTDIALAIPPLVMALAVTAVLTPNLIHAMLAIAALWWTWHTRLIFSITRTLRHQEFVEAARDAWARAASTSSFASSCPIAPRRSWSRSRSTSASSS